MADDLRAGEVVEGRYRLEAPLGEGGYGAVWRATQLNVNRPVAIKFLKAIVADPSAQRRFDREAKALARLQHPNCVTLLDFGHGRHGSFLVTEFLDGKRLDNWIGEGPLVPEVLTVSLQILAALDHAHTEKIVHRDLKPANIVITSTADQEHFAKVLDFGIASVVGAKRGDITKTGEVFGTPGYMSPEQLLGEAHVGPTADLYAFGVMLYQMLQGERLFSGTSGIEIAMKHLTHEPPEITAEIPLGLQDVVTRLLKKHPEERFQSAADVARAIGALTPSGQYPLHMMSRVAHTPPPTTPRPTPPPAWTPSTRAGPLRPPPTAFEPRSAPAPPAPPAVASRRNLIVAALVGVMLVCALVALWLRDPSGTAADPSTPAHTQPGILRSGTELVVTPLPTTSREPLERDAGSGAPLRGQTSAGCGAPFAGEGFLVVEHVTGAGLYRHSARVFVPSSYRPERPHPVIVTFHDVSQSARRLVEELRLDELAERDGAILVLPEHDTIFFTWDEPSSWSRAVEDFNAAAATLCLDLDRVYLYGHGGGGNAAEQVACQLEGVAAVAVSAHRLPRHSTPCEKFATIPYLFLAPLHDGRDPFEGGGGCLLGGEDVVSIPQHENVFRRSHDCEDEERIEWKQKGSFCKTWTCTTPFVSCHIDGGRPLPGEGWRIDKCEGVAADFPYQEKIWSWFHDARPLTDVADAEE